MLTRPIPNTQPAFDATQEQVFSFTSIGGNQVTSNKITIRLQSDNSVIYEDIQTTFSFTHTLPSEILTNGTYYSYAITTYDALGESSLESIAVPFYCYTTPIITSTNIPQSGLIENSSFDFQFKYNQIEGELLNSYIITLYDTNDNPLSSSGTVYVTSSDVPYSFSYLFSGFNDLQSYKIKVDSVTVNNTSVSTGYINFTVKFTKPNMFSTIELVNNCEEGYINFKSNVTVLNGISQPDPPIYINNKEVSILNQGDFIYWQEGIDISDDFLLRIWARDLNKDNIILTMQDNNLNTIILTNREGYAYNSTILQNYIDLKVGNYYIFSNYIDIPVATDYIFIWLKRINNIYELRIENMGGNI